MIVGPISDTGDKFGPDLPSGTTLASFEISGRPGVGGMREVYRAKDSKLGRTVTV